MNFPVLRSGRPIPLILLFAAALLFHASFPAGASSAADVEPEAFLPVPSCAEGWFLEDKPVIYDKDSLFERINGESELYFPYGFDRLATGRYALRGSPSVAIEVDLYRMGSLLEAFGIYANYRRPEDGPVMIGAEGYVSPSQLLFYQDRFFVKLQASGVTSLEKDVLVACARSLSRQIPNHGKVPRELAAFSGEAVAKGSERYHAQSLLGYAFFRRGITADAVAGGKRFTVFAVLGETPDESPKAFDQYRIYIEAGGGTATVEMSEDLSVLKAGDPLYGQVLLELGDGLLVGASKVTDTPAARRLMREVRAGLLKASGR